MDEIAESLASNSLLALKTSTGRCYHSIRKICRVATQGTSYFQYDQFELSDVIWMNPILGRLSNEVLLSSTSSTVPFDRVSLRSD